MFLEHQITVLNLKAVKFKHFKASHKTSTNCEGELFDTNWTWQW